MSFIVESIKLFYMFYLWEAALKNPNGSKILNNYIRSVGPMRIPICTFSKPVFRHFFAIFFKLNCIFFFLVFHFKQVDGYIAGIDYPAYDSVPKGLSFSCKGRLPGYYADLETRCQVKINKIILNFFLFFFQLQSIF